MNVGTIDRIIRALAGLAILSLVFLLDGTARWWGLIGLFPLTTAAIGYCPPYAWLVINTCGRKKGFISR
jgi:hypothetical protein